MAKKLSLQEKKANKVSKRALQLAKMIDGALDTKAPIDSLEERERLIRIILEQSIVADQAPNSFGSEENPTYLNVGSVHDSVICDSCNQEMTVRSEHVPNIVTITKNFGNGEGGSLRSLRRDFGLVSDKSGPTLIIKGFGDVDLDEVRPQVPRSVIDHYTALIEVGDVRCAFEGKDHRCRGLLTNKDKPRSWFMDHKFYTVDNPSYHRYNNDEAFRKSNDSYQPLCISCSSWDREEVKAAKLKLKQK
jgi:hypothetical protein